MTTTSKGNHHDRNQQREAVKVRYERQRQLKDDWEKMSLEQALKTLADMRADMEQGAQIVQQRLSTQKNTEMICTICSKVIPMNPPAQETVRDQETGLMYNRFYCSQECFVRKTQSQTGILSLART
jgi:hypothetical protein